MKRKLVQQGTSTLMVSLPSSWAKANNLKKGNAVDIEENKEFLQIYAKEHAIPYEKKDIDLEKIPRLTERIINSCYRRGIDEIHVRFPNSKVYNEIVKTLQELVGFEIVEQTEKSCVLKGVSQPSIEEFDIVLRRLFLMLLEMGESALDALQKKEINRLQEVKLLEIANNRFSNFLRRVLNKSIYKDRTTTVQLYILVRDLEGIADQYKHICNYCYEKKVILSKEILLLFDEINKHIRKYYDLFYDSNLEKAQEFVLQKDKIMQECLKLFEKTQSLGKHNIKVVHNLTNILQITFDLVGIVFALIP